jgi:RNA polymerase sigma factor (sigma-70 family)
MWAMSGDPDAKLLIEHASFVRRVARGILSDEDAVEEIVQGTFLQALRHPPRASSLRAWLARVARNLAISRWRADRSRHDRERATARREPVSGPEEAAQRLETQRRVVEAVMSLDEPYRMAIMHRYFDDLSPPEIAAHLGIPVQTVRTRLKRALAALRARLDAEHGGAGRACVLALFPLLDPSTRCAVGAGAIGGALAMKKIAVGVAIAALCATGWVTWRALDRRSADTPRAEQHTVAERPLDSERESEPASGSRKDPEPASAAAAEGTYVGLVRLSDGTPLSGAVLSMGNDPNLRGTTDGEGRLRIAGDWTASRELMLRAADGSWSMATGAHAEPGRETVVTLERGRTLSTTVVAETDGKPVPNASVYLGRLDLAGKRGQAQVVWGHTDAAGHVRVEFVPDAAYLVEVSATGFEAYQGRLDFARENLPDPIALAAARPLTVRIEGLPPGSDGQAVRGFVQRSAGGPLRWFEEKLDGRGEFRITAPPPGVHGITIEASDVTPRLTRAIRFTASAADAVVFTLPSGASWSGFVLRADGTPWADAEIRVRDDEARARTARGRPAAAERPPSSWTAHTDDRGFARIAALTPGRKSVDAEIPGGWLPLGQIDIPEQGEARGDFRLPGSAGVRARLLRNGRPEQVMFVLTREPDRAFCALLSSDAEGRIGLEHLAAGEYSIEVRGAVLSRLGTLSLREGEIRDLGDLDLGATAFAEVELVVPDGATLPASVSFAAPVASPGREPSERIQGVTLDERGRALLTMFPQGTHVFRVSALGWADQDVTLTLPSPEPVRILLKSSAAR